MVVLVLVQTTSECLRTTAEVTQLEKQWDWDPNPSVFDFKTFFFFLADFETPIPHTKESEECWDLSFCLELYFGERWMDSSLKTL